MSKFYFKYILLTLTALLFIDKSYCQDCLHCVGGSSDGYANAVLSSCAAPATIFAGGIYTRSASGLAGTCSFTGSVFASGGSHSGFSNAADGTCTVPASIVSGGGFDGFSHAAVSPCNPPVTVLTGGAYDGISIASVAPCSPPSTVLTGGSYDGFSNSVVSICSPPATILKGGEYDGMNAAFVYCSEVLAIQDQENMETFGIGLYPNPASGDFTISFNKTLPEGGSIIIKDVLGKEIANQSIYPFKQLYSFKAKQWEEGVYFLFIAADGKHFTRQLLVIKNVTN